MTAIVINLRVEILLFLNLPLYLNNIQFIRDFAIENTGKDELFAVEIKILSDHSCIHPSTFCLDSIKADIVGDPKQKLPTSFFSSIKLDEENMEVEDLESILDDCLAFSVPSKYLLRHYRSKHESLIAFSNVNYYENKLLTFLSADDLAKKVIHRPIWRLCIKTSASMRQNYSDMQPKSLVFLK